MSLDLQGAQQPLVIVMTRSTLRRYSVLGPFVEMLLGHWQGK